MKKSGKEPHPGISYLSKIFIGFLIFYILMVIFSWLGKDKPEVIETTTWEGYDENRPVWEMSDIDYENHRIEYIEHNGESD